jgi:predicted small lipoprotein YifL
MTDADCREIAIMAARPGVGRDMRSGALALKNSPILVRVAVAGMVVAALTLSGCGRKGALEPPPSASAGKEDGAAAPPAKPDRHFILDPLVK